MNDLLSKYSIDIDKINKIEWKTQNSTEDSILFYSINNSKNSIDIFKDRIKKSSYKYCIINKAIEQTDSNIVSVNDNEFLELQKIICDELLPFNKNFKSVCVTGTNGKTTTVDLLRQLCLQQKISIMTVGTLGVWLNTNCVENFGLTSPTYIDFRKMLNKYDNKIDLLAVEISSHAFVQKRYFRPKR